MYVDGPSTACAVGSVMPSRYSPAHEHMSGVSSRSEIGVRLQLTKLDCN
jgi:hypothetical protein